MTRPLPAGLLCKQMRDKHASTHTPHHICHRRSCRSCRSSRMLLLMSKGNRATRVPADGWCDRRMDAVVLSASCHIRSAKSKQLRIQVLAQRAGERAHTSVADAAADILSTAATSEHALHARRSTRTDVHHPASARRESAAHVSDAASTGAQHAAAARRPDVQRVAPPQDQVATCKLERSRSSAQEAALALLGAGDACSARPAALNALRQRKERSKHAGIGCSLTLEGTAGDLEVLGATDAPANGRKTRPLPSLQQVKNVEAVDEQGAGTEREPMGACHQVGHGTDRPAHQVTRGASEEGAALAPESTCAVVAGAGWGAQSEAAVAPHCDWGSVRSAQEAQELATNMQVRYRIWQHLLHESHMKA